MIRESSVSQTRDGRAESLAQEVETVGQAFSDATSAGPDTENVDRRCATR